MSFTICFSNEVEAIDFIETVSNNGLGPNFYPQDVKWDHTGTMAVVVGYDTTNGPNAYAYFPLNDTWMPLEGYYPGQSLSSVDYWYDQANATVPPVITDVLVVDADAYNEGTSNFYGMSLLNNSVSTVDLWDVYGNFGPAQGKPTSEDMAPYDAVFWVPDREMDALGMQGPPGGPFDANDENEVGTYLAAGGNFMLANTYWSQYTSASEGPYDYTAGDFAYDYFGLDKIWDISSNFDSSVNETAGDAVYGGIGVCPLNWNGGGWNHAPPPVGVCDELRAGPGTICFFGSNGASYQPMGIRYDIGVFKTVFFGFPFETLSGTDKDEIMGLTLDWFATTPAGGGGGPIEFGAGGATPKASTKTILDQSNENFGNAFWLDVGMDTTNLWAQSFVPNENHISKVEFYMYAANPSPDYFHIQICQDWGGDPSYPDNITQGWIMPGSVPIGVGNADWVECWFENGGGTLIPGNTYWIVCERIGFTQQQYWLEDSDQMYGPGVAKEKMGPGWSPPLGYDWLFRTYANETSGIPSATLGPDKDNGIFSESNDESNGAGMVLRAGRSGVGDIRRSLIHFDVASGIPAGSTIDHVELKMYCNKSSGGPQDITLNRVQFNWGEGTSDDGGTMAGDPATPGDATWHYTFWPTTTWFTDGGNYVAPSATRTLTVQDEFYTWGTSSWMVSDVQGWLDTPGSNYGWAIVGDEVTPGLIKQLSSRENSNHTRRPELKIFYTPPNGSVTVSILPEKDNTIYDNQPPPEWSNGWGDNLLSGMDAGGNIKRALMKFDIESAIPDGATITAVNLTMYCDMVDNSNPETLRINSLTADWGEASSHAPGEEWNPFGAQIGDASWNFAYFNTAMWASTGGDFIPAPSATSTVFVKDLLYRWSSATMISDVQGWLDNAGTNNGWILIGNEGTPQTTKRFGSRSNRTVSHRPMLNITYTMGSNGTGNGTTPVGMGTFWMCGDNPGGMPATASTVYKLEPTHNFTMQKVSTWPQYGSHIQFTAIACDELGNPLAVGNQISNMYYYNDSDSTWNQVGSSLNAYDFRDVDFNPNDGRFYVVGGIFNALWWEGTCFFTDVGPLWDGASAYQDSSTFNWNQYIYNSIAWNHLYNYGMVVGEGGVYIAGAKGASNELNWTAKVNNSANIYFDCDWDTDGWNEAGIVGTNQTGDAYYWRYYHTNPQVMDGNHTSTPSVFYCCAFKPPSSPKWLFIPYNGGGYQVNVEENDQSSTLTINANFPHIFSVGFWKQSDIFHTPLNDTQQVDPGTTYTFCVEANYTQGGVDHWNDAALEIAAWYDEGWTGINSNPDDPTWSTEDHRTRQFNMTYDVGPTTSTMNYPAGFPEEFAVHSIWVDPNTYGFDSSHRRLYINLTFKAQTLASDGDGIWDGPTSGRTYEKNFALNDANSWDFRVALYDSVSTDVRNETFGEFGVKETMSIIVSGNPGGSLPPGSVDSPLSEPSVITYSSNTEYWVNVSIPHLYKDGNIASPYWIPATGVTVRNNHILAGISSSDIWAQTSFPGSGQQLSIWGTSGPLSPLNPTYNGTISAGPGASEYTDFLYGIPSTTEVFWWVTVPALPEGSYWGTITLSIEDY